MEFEERLTETSRECGRGLGDTAFGTCKLSGETRKEVVLGLFGAEDRNGRKNTKGICAEEDNLLSSGASRDGANDVLDVVDGVRHARVLGCAAIGEVDLAVSIYRYVLEQCVATDSSVDVGLAFLIQVDNLSVATAFEVEYAVVVPSVFVVADEQALGVGRKGGFTRSRKAEEDSGVFAVEVGVGRAVHRGNAFEGQVVVHHGEHTLLHFAAIPGVEDNLLSGCNVEHNGCFRV